MRSTLTIILIIISLTAQAQNYNAIIEDTAVTNFMTWLLTRDTSVIKNHKAIRYVDHKIRGLDAEDFTYHDTSKYRPARNVFSNNNAGNLLNENDAKYFIRQLQTRKMSKWDLQLKKIKLVDTITMYTRKTIYSYSLPIFSVDKRKVIIVQAFFCGIVCGGGEYSLYERQNDNDWRKIKSFNVWAE